MEKTINQQSSCCAGSVDYSEPTTHLKVIKGSSAYIAYYSSDGNAWNRLGKYTDINFSAVKVGLYGINSRTQPLQFPLTFIILHSQPIPLTMPLMELSIVLQEM